MPERENTYTTPESEWFSQILPLLERPEMYFRQGRFIDNLAAFLYGAGLSASMREEFDELHDTLAVKLE